MEPFLNSGGTFCPHSGNIAKIQFKFTIHTNWNLSVTPFFIRIFQIYIVPEPFLQVM